MGDTVQVNSVHCTKYTRTVPVTVGATTSILSLYMQCGGGEGSPWLVVSAVYFFGKIFYRHGYKVPVPVIHIREVDCEIIWICC